MGELKKFQKRKFLHYQNRKGQTKICSFSFSSLYNCSERRYTVICIKEKKLNMGILKEEMQLLSDLGNGYNEIDAFNHSMIASVVKPEDINNTFQAIYTLRKNGKDAFFRKVVGELYAKQN